MQQLRPHVEELGVHALLLYYAHKCGLPDENLARYAKDTVADTEQHQRDIEGVIRSRCMGMLEITHESAEISTHNRNTPTLTRCTVDYIHKSVAEYLDQIEIGSKVSESSNDGYNVNVAILGAFAILSRSPFYRIESEFSYFVRRAERATRRPQLAAVALFDQNLSKLYRPMERDRLQRGDFESPHWSNHLLEDYNRPCTWHDTTLSFAIRCGWELYVLEALRKHGKGLPAKQGRPLLDYAVRPEPTYSPYVYGINNVIVRALLEHGADPNASFNGYTAWSNLLYCIARSRLWPSRSFSENVDKADMPRTSILPTIINLLEFGADLEATCERYRKISKRNYVKETTSGREVVQDLLEGLEPADELSIKLRAFLNAKKPSRLAIKSRNLTAPSRWRFGRLRSILK